MVEEGSQNLKNEQYWWWVSWFFFPLLSEAIWVTELRNGHGQQKLPRDSSFWPENQEREPQQATVWKSPFFSCFFFMSWLCPEASPSAVRAALLYQWYQGSCYLKHQGKMIPEESGNGFLVVPFFSLFSLGASSGGWPQLWRTTLQSGV